MIERPELISRKVRGEFRDICSSWGVVRQIERAFEDEGFDRPAENSLTADVWKDGQRRGVFALYTSNVDWTDPVQVRKMLPVLAEILSWVIPDNDASVIYRERVISLLARDGFDVTSEGRIVASKTRATPSLPLELVEDPSALLGHLSRLAEGAESDPPLAISQAKALIEATTKLVLKELGKPYDEKADLSELIKSAQKELALHPDALAPDAKGVEISKRVLGSLAQVAIGLSELRNLYGLDHGKSAVPGPLSVRHAHLAIGCATTYCTMLIETLEYRLARRE
jgi:hypothetical protein